MQLPPDWEAESAPGPFSNQTYLIHPACGFRTGMAYNLHGAEPFGEVAARRLVYSHECNPED